MLFKGLLGSNKPTKLFKSYSKSTINEISDNFKKKGERHKIDFDKLNAIIEGGLPDNEFLLTSDDLLEDGDFLIGYGMGLSFEPESIRPIAIKKDNFKGDGVYAISKITPNRKTGLLHQIKKLM